MKATFLLLILAVCLLVTLGLVMLASTTYFIEEGRGEEYFTLWKQIKYLGIGALGCAFFAMFDYSRFQRWRWHVLGVAGFLLALVLVPGVGFTINGATRWLGVGGLRVQPSEFAKIAVVIALAAWFARNEATTSTFTRGFILPGLILAVVVLPIGMEPDLGNASLAAAVGLSIMFVAGTRWHYLLISVLAAGSALAGAIHYYPNRMARIISVYDLEKYKDTYGLQQWVAQLAFGSGGIRGLGLGDGRMKLDYLPEAHTDFIFPVVGEELGLYAVIGTVLMFVFILIAGMSISSCAPDRFGKLLGFGLTLLLSMEALLNMGVTTSLLPNKGLPLPFVSYVGSSLVAAMIIIGILLNIHRQGVHVSWDQLPVIRRKHRFTPQI